MKKRIGVRNECAICGAVCVVVCESVLTEQFESAAFWAVTIMTAVASVRRNRFVDFGAEDYYKIA